jgi:starch synthase (maltosyl-transferring)
MKPADQTDTAIPHVPLPAEGRRRVVIEAVSPEIACGRFPIKRVVGERVTVEADVFADGHDRLAAVLRHRYVGPEADRDTGWREAPMAPLGNDRWGGTFQVEHLGRYEYTVEAWVHRFASWVHGLEAKLGAGQDVSSDLQEGAQIVRSAAARTKSGVDRQHFLEIADALDSSQPAATRVLVAIDAELAERMAAVQDRGLSTSYGRVLGVKVDRVRARTGAWYEMFPRSAGSDPSRSATFAEAARRLPDIAAMGFDVLYLPPIHPIGTTGRKGRGNALVAGPDDVGSPWAIGAAAGGHTAVDPALGTLDDFLAFRAEAERHGLEIALDLAYQSSPDHPYVAQHPEWFRHRPDGTIKYAENPPKKYQDIFPFEFDTDAWRALWEELRDVVLFWVDRGVRIFRVDNPHTKPLAFWEWLIADVQARDPGVIFLSEAFTRPKMMRHLARLGFTQSYTYFTWRNTKAEIEAYFTELTTTELGEYFRPNLFANTPDILHAYLQNGGPPAFRIRFVLAATLGPSYGIYSGFELCENRAVPGTEEYLGSEKYQIRPRDWDAPGHIKELIARVNGLRRRYPALAVNDGLRFHLTTNEQLIAYSKTAPGVPRREPGRRSTGSGLAFSESAAARVLMVVSLDPHQVQEGLVCVALPDDPVEEDESYEVRDLLTDAVYRWRGPWNYVRLDPTGTPAHVLAIERGSGREEREEPE